MEKWYIGEQSVDGARGRILYTITGSHRHKMVIYFDGWNGFGEVPVLRSIAQEERRFDKIIYLVCSVWESRRVMQRKIAEELKLDHATMKLFDTQDEEDDFNGVDHTSRDVIQGVVALTYQALKDMRFMMIFINGNYDENEIDVTSFGIPVAKYLSNRLVWTFNRRLLTIRDIYNEIQPKLRDTHLFLYNDIRRLSSSEFSALLHEEAASIVARHPCMQAIDLTTITNCGLYALFLHYSFHSTTGFDWTSHASNYWICAGIIKGDTKSEIVNALHKEIRWECYGPLLEYLFRKFKRDPKAPFLVFKRNVLQVEEEENPKAPFLVFKRNVLQVEEEENYQTRPYHWVCITSKYLTIPEEDMHTILEKSSSLFVVFKRSNDPPKLPNGLFKYCSNLAVLTLCFCTFSFVSPPFLGCRTIKFLGLEHCTDNKASKGNDSIKDWAHLQSLLVLDLRNTDWDYILCEEKLEIMDNLTELNIEGFICWQYISQLLQTRLPRLQSLRVINPLHQAAVPTETRDSLMDKKRLQILDLSGNKEMKNLPTSIKSASNLEVLVLDGCDELENVVLSPASLLRSFSFDGYGPTAQWKSMVDLAPESSRPKTSRANKTMKISLQGCKQLKNLFLRGLPNLKELDLSGSTIKILDFKSTVVDVPNLKRLILLGCEHLRAIRWVSRNNYMKLELLCIDTRPGWSSTEYAQPSLDNKHNKSYKLQVHAIIVDARLVKSLYYLMVMLNRDDVYFNIHITKSSVCGGFVPQEEATGTKMIGRMDQPNIVQVGQYDDISKEIHKASSSMETFPQPPGPESDGHIEIVDDGSYNIESEMKYKPPNLGAMMFNMAVSLHMHDSSNISGLSGENSSYNWVCLRWCRVARCPNLDTIFYIGNNFDKLETVWASDLPMARCIWSKRLIGRKTFGNLQHLHLRSCPRLQFVMPVWVRSFPNLRSLCVIHCGNLGHVFVHNDESSMIKKPIEFLKLTTIHLHDLPKLQQISELRMLAPALETIRIRGCFNLRRLPSMEGRAAGAEKPAVEIEKDVWNALEWDGLAVGHHRDLFQPPVHSRHYRRRFIRGTVLR